MKLPICAALLASSLLLPCMTLAADEPLTDSLKAFARCDATFFTSLQRNSAAWAEHAPLKQENGVAWIAVQNRSRLAADLVVLNDLPPVAGMKLLTYFDESTDLGKLGHYLFWGFIVEGGIDDVAKKLVPLLEQPALMRPLDGTYVRSERKNGDRWLAIRPQPGAVGTDQVERVLLLEPEGTTGTQTRLSCSLQGAVDGPLVATLRPDIPPTEYPKTAATPE